MGYLIHSLDFSNFIGQPTWAAITFSNSPNALPQSAEISA